MMERQYKDSGIEWIGRIPKEWDVKRLKNLCVSSNSLIADGDWIESQDISEEGIRYYTTGNIGDGVFKEQGNGFITESTFEKLKCTPVYPGDLVFSRLNVPIGRSCIIPNIYPICVVAVDNVIVRPDSSYDKQYLMYVSMCPGYQETNMLIARGTTMQRMSRTQLENIYLPIPPLPEQQRIASYLDKKCGEIDELIALQEKMIAQLTEYKQAVITEAVTKGLDPNAKLVPSGIEWIGDVPEGWRTMKTLYCLSMPITDGPHETPELYDDGVPFISADAVSDGFINFDNKRGYISEEYYEECCKKYIPQQYDIYMIKSGASTGRTAIVETDKKFTIWSPLAVFRSNRNVILPYYLLYTLRSDYYQKQVQNNWSYGTQQNIGMRTLEKLNILVPSLPEQHSIASYLDTKCSEIDTLIALKRQKIESLNAYKKSVIYETVTGKISI